MKQVYIIFSVNSTFYLKFNKVFYEWILYNYSQYVKKELSYIIKYNLRFSLIIIKFKRYCNLKKL